MDIHATLNLLDINERSQKVFLYLIDKGTSTVVTISKDTALPKSSVYDALSDLSSQNLIVEYSENRSKEFGVISVEQFKEIGAKKLAEISQANKFLEDFMIHSPTTAKSSRPKITFYKNAEGIRQAFRDNMWHAKCKDSYLMWPTEEMVAVLGEEFSKWHSAQRLKFDVHLHVVQSHTDRKMLTTASQQKLLKSSGWATNHSIRYAPKGMIWDMSYWIYDDKTLFAGVGEDKFAFIVHSKEFAQLMQMLWQQVWNISKG